MNKIVIEVIEHNENDVIINKGIWNSLSYEPNNCSNILDILQKATEEVEAARYFSKRAAEICHGQYSITIRIERENGQTIDTFNSNAIKDVSRFVTALLTV